MFASFPWKMPLLPRPPTHANAGTEAPMDMQMTPPTATNMHANVHMHSSPPILTVDKTLSSVSGASTSSTSMVVSSYSSLSTNERETMKANKRPGTVKLIPTTAPVTCLEDLRKIALPTKLNNLGRRGSGSDQFTQQNQKHTEPQKFKQTLSADYVPSVNDVQVNTDQLKSQSQFRSSPRYFQRLVQHTAAQSYSEPSTVVERRKAVLRVMRAVESRGGLFLCPIQVQVEEEQLQQWAVVADAHAESSLVRLLEQVARARRPVVSKMARTACIVDSLQAPIKAGTSTSTAQQKAQPQVSILLHRHPIAPPRPRLRLRSNKSSTTMNTTTKVTKKPACPKGACPLTKPVLQQQQQQQQEPQEPQALPRQRQMPRQSLKKQKRKSSSTPSTSQKHQKRQAMQPPFPRPPVQTRAVPQQAPKGAKTTTLSPVPRLYQTQTTANDSDELPRRVSWDKATMAVQKQARANAVAAASATTAAQKQAVALYQARQQARNRALSQSLASFNALDLLSTAAILDDNSSGNSSTSSAASSDGGDEHDYEEQMQVVPHPGSLIKLRQERLRHVSERSITPLMHGDGDAHATVKAELSYIWG
jgi:hypothetical protein